MEDVTYPSVTFMCKYGRTKDDSLTNKAFISIDHRKYLPKLLQTHAGRGGLFTEQ